MNIAPSSAATNANARKCPAPSASEVPTNTGATAAGRVRTRAAITQMCTGLDGCTAATRCVVMPGSRSCHADRLSRERAARSRAPRKTGEVGVALALVRLAPLARLLAAAEQQVGVVRELLDARQPVLGRVEARLQQSQRERGELEHLPTPPHRLLLQLLEWHDRVDQTHIERLLRVVLAAQKPDLL